MRHAVSYRQAGRVSPVEALRFYLGAVLIALLLGAVVLLAIGVNPVDYYWRMFTMGMVGNKIAYRAFENYLKVFVPLVMTAVALSLAFKMRFWNIGGEGQFILGAVAAAAVAFQAGPLLPQPLTLVLMCLAAMLAAGLYGVLTAVFKVKFGTSETLLTLMLNYVALYFLTFLGETKAAWNFFLEPSSARPIFTSFSRPGGVPRPLHRQVRAERVCDPGLRRRRPGLLLSESTPSTAMRSPWWGTASAPPGTRA